MKIVIVGTGRSVSSRERVRELVEAPRFQRGVIAVIVLNAIALGCETSPALLTGYDGLLHFIDRAALAVFVAEIGLRWYAGGARFLRDPWNCFDTAIVAVALVPATGAFGVLRTLRIFRALRLVSAIPSMRRVVSALLTAVPGMSSIAALLGLIVYVGAVVATTLFSGIAPEYFGDLGDSLFTLFQVMTGEAWSDVAREVMDQEPLAWVFFVAYIAVTTFTVLNLFIAVAVSAMESQVAAEREPDPAVGALLAEVRELRGELRELRAEGSERPAG